MNIYKLPGLEFLKVNREAIIKSTGILLSDAETLEDLRFVIAALKAIDLVGVPLYLDPVSAVWLQTNPDVMRFASLPTDDSPRRDVYFRLLGKNFERAPSEDRGLMWIHIRVFNPARDLGRLTSADPVEQIIRDIEGEPKFDYTLTRQGGRSAWRIEQKGSSEVRIVTGLNRFFDDVDPGSTILVKG